MDGVKKRKKLRNIFLKYRYPAIILLVGVLLMLIPSNKRTEITEVAVEPVTPTMEERLAQILSTIDGAGEVRVLLSVAQGERVVYQSDVESNVTSDNESIYSKTVMITDAQRGENGLVQQRNPPQYLGAVVSCQGADEPVVCLMIVDAVATATGLGADKITVMKMK